MKKLTPFIGIVIAIVIINVFRALTVDKNITSKSNFNEFNLFDSTFQIKTPFELKEKPLPNPNSQFLEKASGAAYQSKNALFMCTAYKLLPGATVRSLDKGVELLVKNLSEQRGTSSKFVGEDSLTINNIQFKRYTGYQEYLNASPINQKAPFNFVALTTSNAKYGYVIYFDDNENNSDIDSTKKKIFDSIKIIQN